ncbi:MAG: GNAT family N-acetyltransferase [Betaproteobacteria bacterium]
MSEAVIELRLAGSSDARPIAVMSRDFIETGLGWSYPPQRIAALLREPDTVCLIARHGGTLAGFGIMSFGDEHAHLVLLAVRPALRRRGVGRRVVEWLTQSTMTAGLVSVHVEMRAQNTDAQAFYRTLGFSETLRLAGYYRGRETAIRMLRVLRTTAVTPMPWRPPTLDPR